MSSSTNMRKEIRGKREASLPARVKGKIEVTERKKCHPKAKWREWGGGSEKEAQRQRKAEGKLPTARREVGLWEPNKGSKWLHQSKQTAQWETREEMLWLGALWSLVLKTSTLGSFRSKTGCRFSCYDIFQLLFEVTGERVKVQTGRWGNIHLRSCWEFVYVK